MCSENCTPASLPVEDGQEFGTLATLATFGSQKQDGATGRAALPDIALRWTATGLLEAKREFRHIKGYQELLLLQRAPKSVTGSAGGAGPPPVVRLESESDMVNSLRRVRNCRCITFPLLIAYPRGFLTLCAHDKYTR